MTTTPNPETDFQSIRFATAFHTKLHYIDPQCGYPVFHRANIVTRFYLKFPSHLSGVIREMEQKAHHPDFAAPASIKMQIEFLTQAGAMLDRPPAQGPAFTVHQYDRGTCKLLEEEYWVKGQRIAAPTAPALPLPPTTAPILPPIVQPSAPAGRAAGFGHA